MIEKLDSITNYQIRDQSQVEYRTGKDGKNQQENDKIIKGILH